MGSYLDIARQTLELLAASTPAAAGSNPEAVAPVVAVIRKPHVAHNRGNVEWYTPAEYIDAARQVMGTIDLDPASSEEANRVVRAERFHTKADDGLVQPWRGNVWMNPPFKAALIARFVDKLCHHVAMGDVVQAIILTNNATETQWYSRLTAVSSALCMVRGRIKFWSPDGRVSAPFYRDSTYSMSARTGQGFMPCLPNSARRYLRCRCLLLIQPRRRNPAPAALCAVVWKVGKTRARAAAVRAL